MLGVKRVGDLETFDPVMSSAGRRGGSPRQGCPQGTTPEWEMGLLACEEMPVMAKAGLSYVQSVASIFATLQLSVKGAAANEE